MNSNSGNRQFAVPARSRAGGFTLIEVMIALTIAALALAAATAAVSQMIDGARGMQERTYASWIAQNRIVELRLANVLPEVSRTTSQLDFAGEEWSLETAVIETGVENLFRVDVSVSRRGSDEVSGVVTGFVGEPVIPGDANTAWSSASQASGATE
jgi:general secretion pathway protein I